MCCVPCVTIFNEKNNYYKTHKMRKLLYLFAASTLTLTMSCNQSPKGNKTDATDAYAVDESNSDGATACHHATKIYWKGAKPSGEHNGIIKLTEGGTFVTDGDKLVGGEFNIDMSSIICIDLENADMNAKLVSHLKSEDFFFVDSFPTATFAITNVESIDGGEFNSVVKGNLTLRGVTKGISFKAVVKVNDGVVSAKSEEFVLDRTQWGVEYKSKSVFKDLKDKFINDEFSLMIDAHSM